MNHHRRQCASDSPSEVGHVQGRGKRLVNLVATRLIDGDHATLCRWYNDHVFVLMGFPALLRATLYRQSGDDTGASARQYLCLYEFTSYADFLEFEGSDAREQARRIGQAGWARGGIEITQRSQYLRHGVRSGSATASGVQHVQCLDLGPGPLAGISRWMSDRLYCALPPAELASLAFHRAVDASEGGGDALVLMDIPDATALRPLPAWWKPGPANDVWGSAPATVQLRWQAAYQHVACWAR